MLDFSIETQEPDRWENLCQISLLQVLCGGGTGAKTAPRIVSDGCVCRDSCANYR